MVPRDGIEPSLLSEPDFESGASTSSTTPASGKTFSIPAMELLRISLKRDQTDVFQSLSLTLPERRIGLIGPNGSGKSSLLRLIKGILKPDAGELRVPNRVGFVFQNPDHQLLFPTVMEELCFGLIDQGVSKLEAEQKAGALLAQYNLLQLKDKATHELSDGQKQLLCILSVLLDGAELLLFDEPCSSLDRKTTEFIMQVIAGLPIPVMMATHDLRLLKDFDRIIWLESGAVLHDGNAQTLIAAYEAQ